MHRAVIYRGRRIAESRSSAGTSIKWQFVVAKKFVFQLVRRCAVSTPDRNPRLEVLAISPMASNPRAQPLGTADVDGLPVGVEEYVADQTLTKIHTRAKNAAKE